MNEDASFYVFRGEPPTGPFTAEAIRAKMAAGELNESTLVNCAGISWAPVAELLEGERAAVGPELHDPELHKPTAGLRPGTASGTGEPLPLSAVLLDLLLVVLFVLGAGAGLYYWLVFDGRGGDGTALKNIIGGSAMAIVVLLVKILRKLGATRGH